MQLGNKFSLCALLCAAILVAGCGGGGGSSERAAASQGVAATGQDGVIASQDAAVGFPLPGFGLLEGGSSQPALMLGSWISDCRSPAQSGYPSNSFDTMTIAAVDSVTGSLRGSLVIHEFSDDNCKNAIASWKSYDLVATPTGTVQATAGSPFTGSGDLYHVSLTPSAVSTATSDITDSYTIAFYQQDLRMLRVQEGGGWITATASAWLKQ